MTDAPLVMINHPQTVGLLILIVPPDVRVRVQEARRYWTETGGCVYRTILA